MLQRWIAALNTISSPILAVIVIVIGCVFAVVSKHYGLDGNTAAGIVGAGIGLLTGQVLSQSKSLNPSAPAETSLAQTTQQDTPQIPQGR